MAKRQHTHAGETPFADRPLAAERFFGEEGLSSTGLSAGYLIPVPFYLNLEAEVTAPPPADQGGVFASTDQHNALVYLGRVSTFVDLTDATNVNASATFADGPASLAATGGTAAPGSRATAGAGELTVRWKNPTRAIYRSFTWQTEGYLVRYELAAAYGAPAAHQSVSGMFSYVDYQFARRTHVGLRFDLAERIQGGVHDTGELAFVTFTPSEFMLMSLQARHVRTAEGTDEWNEFFKLTFNIGPHGAHPF
ncbi:MAG TPA: hypothetical protein VMS93_08420 [Candidatus Saccharimonadales bacterium]|nr:hypothetical protein [Candidatus Saccharimonadales bacterium]